MLSNSIIFSQEICDNGIDDDGDGQIDLNDSDCYCINPSLISLLPNPSFEIYSSCPSGFSELNYATPWIQATNGTTDYFNTCSSFMMPALLNSSLLNFPNGNGITGAFYRDVSKEYLGLQLSSPLLAGTNYQLTFKIASLTSDHNGYSTPYNINIFEPVNITIFGNPNNTNFPLNTFLSPDIIDSNWIDIGHVKYTPTSNWDEITIIFTPNININSLMIGAPTILPVSYNEPTALIGNVYAYFLYDNLILNKSSDFKININQIGDLCSNNLVLQSNLTSNSLTNITYQWYKNNIAINGATNPTYAIPFDLSNIGTYCVKITDGNQCFISNRLTIKNSITSPNITATQPNCTNLTGSIQVTSLAAEYSFDGGITWQTNPNSGPLQPSRYFVKTRTTAGCISESKAVDLSHATLLPPPLYTTVQPSCTNPQGSGISITITSVGSVFSFDDGLTWTTNNTANNLLANSTYYIRYKDLNGCLSNSAQVYLYTQYIDNAPTISIQQPTNCLNNYGIITVLTNASLYSFDNGNTWSTNSISPQLSQGTYMIRVKQTPNSCQSLARTAIINAPLNVPNPPTYNVLQPVSCSNPYGVISITSLASQYSFDDGITWSTNTNSGNLPVGTYLLKVKDALNCESPSVSVTINEPVDYPLAPNFTTLQPDCFNQNGTIIITSLGSEFSIDNGITWNTNNSFNNLSPGNYQIRIKNTLGCISPVSNAILNVFIPSINLPIVNSSQQFCIQQNATLNNIAISGQNIKWYDSATGGNLLPNTTSLQNGITYYASQTINGCESTRVQVLVSIQNSTAPTGNQNQSFCSTENATFNNIAITGTNIIWYNSLSGNTILPTSTLLQNGVTYYASQTINGCESQTRLAVSIQLINTLNANNYSETICDDLNNGFETINLSNYNSLLISSAGNIFKYYNSLNGAQNQVTSDEVQNSSNYNLSLGNNLFYVRIESPNTCFQIVTLNLTLVSKPFININDVKPICEGSSITIDAGFGYDNYTWSTGETSSSIIVTQPGNYSVTASENHGTLVCSTTKNFTVVNSNIGTISEIITSDWTQDENTISVLISSNSAGIYEYSLNGIDFQDSNTFYGLENGEYTVFIRDKNGCGVSSEDVYLLMYPKYFTPNGDGYNDFWRIKFSENEPNLTVTIFDRYGKLITQFDSNNVGWNGTYQGNPMPSTDYWFVVKRENGKEYKGHFTLKR